jgi:nicotinamidase-related amidase
METIRSAQRINRDQGLPSRETALVIIDMMNLFCDPGFLAKGIPQREKWYASELADVVPCIQGVLNSFREAHAMVVHLVNAKWTREAREAAPYQRGRDYDFLTPTRCPSSSPSNPCLAKSRFIK